MYIPVGKPDKRRKAAGCLGLGRGDTCWAGRSWILGAVRTNRHKDTELSGLYSRVDFSRTWCLVSHEISMMFSYFAFLFCNSARFRRRAYPVDAFSVPRFL